MPVEFKSLKELQKMPNVRPGRRLYLTIERDRVVEDGDPDAAFLLCTEFDDIPEEVAHKYDVHPLSELQSEVAAAETARSLPPTTIQPGADKNVGGPQGTKDPEDPPKGSSETTPAATAPNAGEWPKHVGAGSWDASDGTRHKGKQAALDYEASLQRKDPEQPED